MFYCQVVEQMQLDCDKEQICIVGVGMVEDVVGVDFVQNVFNGYSGINYVWCVVYCKNDVGYDLNV